MDISEIKKLLSILRDAIQDESELAIFGSAAIALRGVDLEREIGDVDAFVSAEAFERLGRRLGVKNKRGKDGETVPYIQPANDIEILSGFPGVSFNQVISNASVVDDSDDLRVGALTDLILWKREQGREKDFNDIEKIERFLKSIST